MKRHIVKIGHRIAGMTAMLTMIVFLSASLYAEWQGSLKLIAEVKEKIVFALPILFVLMPGAALSGRSMAGYSSEIAKRKLRRMRWIAANALLLITIAIVLYLKASSGNFDTVFWILQILEFSLGSVNIILMAMMIADGMRLSGRLIKKSLV